MMGLMAGGWNRPSLFQARSDTCFVYQMHFPYSGELLLSRSRLPFMHSGPVSIFPVLFLQETHTFDQLPFFLSPQDKRRGSASPFRPLPAFNLCSLSFSSRLNNDKGAGATV
jgi:hypothetical protein